jgi:hypothetical protein
MVKVIDRLVHLIFPIHKCTFVLLLFKRQILTHINRTYVEMKTNPNVASVYNGMYSQLPEKSLFPISI